MKKFIPLLIFVLGIVSIVYVFWYLLYSPSVVIQRKTDEEARKQTEIIQKATKNLQSYNDCLMQVLLDSEAFEKAHPNLTAQEAQELELSMKAKEVDCSQKYPQ